MDLASFFRRNDLPAEDLAREDATYGALTQAVRELAEAQLLTTVDLDTVQQVTAEIRALTERLQTDTRPGAFGIELGPDEVPRNHGNTVVGLRNPIAVALADHPIVWNDRGASATLELGPLYEGPPGCVHGGVLALVLDQLFGEAAAAGGGGGMTGRLTLSYRRPTPLGQITMDAWVERADGIKTVVKGALHDADGNLTVQAEGLFIMPRWAREQADSWPKRNRNFE